jgi:hypothetical protein
LKNFFKYIQKRPEFISWQVKNSLRIPINHFVLKGTPLVWNPKVYEHLERIDKFEGGGVHVLTAPPGSGKSTYIRKFLSDRMTQVDKYCAYISSELRESDQFFERFGSADRRNDLFQYIPNGSLLVFDQVETLALTNDLNNLIRHCALESRRLANCNVVVSVSSAPVACQILNLNGND